jgi:hypothetical protein
MQLELHVTAQPFDAAATTRQQTWPLGHSALLLQ